MTFDEYLDKSLKGEIKQLAIPIYPWGDYTFKKHLDQMHFQGDMVEKGWEAFHNNGPKGLRGRAAREISRKNAYWYGYKLAEKGFPKPIYK